MDRNRKIIRKKLTKLRQATHRQQGLAIVVMLFLIGLVSLAFLVKIPSTSNIQIQRSETTNTNLAQAKQAVISAVLLNSSTTTLGVFPCPEDTSVIGAITEGQQSACANNTTSIGRLAWRSLSYGHLRDGNGDDFWYILAPNLRSPPINSDVFSSLTVDGNSNGALALVYSPGNVLSTNNQTRPVPTSAAPPAATNYLDGENSDGDDTFISGAITTTFNDQLTTIKHSDVFPVLEKRVLGEFKNYLTAYKAIWGAFPFPAQFGNPTSSSFSGDISQTGGFLPIANTGATTTWNTSNPVAYAISNSGNSNVYNPSCTYRTSNTRIRCEFSISNYDSSSPPSVTITGIVNGIGLRFYSAMSVSSSSDMQITTRSGSATVTNSSRALSHSLNATGQGIVTFTGTLANNGTVRIEFRRTPQLSTWVLAATNHYLLGGNSGNNWHHLAYYKVAAPFLPGGSGNCGTCLSVNQVSSPTQTNTQTDIHAVLMSAGWRLDSTDHLPAPTYNVGNPAQTRPSATLNAYFDSNNNTSGGLVFDNQYLTDTFNDQIEVVE